MDKVEFDRFADAYDQQLRDVIGITGEQPEYFAEYKIQFLSTLVIKYGIQARRIIDFGSGIGNSTPHVRKHLPEARLTNADVSRRSLDLAEQRFPGLAESLHIEGERIPDKDAIFDLAFSACVFHHIDHDEHIRWLRELRRITRPEGLLVVFEHNPLNPLTVRAVNTCPFDENARLIRSRQLALRFEAAGWARPKIRYHLFLPRLLAALRPFERALTAIPLGAQYSVVARNPA